MSEASDSRRNFLVTALGSIGAFVGALVAGGAAQAKLVSDPLVREMSKRAWTPSAEDRGATVAGLCSVATCNPGCQNGCSAGCQASCKTGSQ